MNKWKFTKAVLAAAVFLITAHAYTQTAESRSVQVTSLEQALLYDMEDGSPEHFSMVQAAFILSGAEKEDSLSVYLNWFDSLIGKIRDFRFNAFEPVQTAAKVFAYLHATLLKTYSLESTTLLDIIYGKKYNCVSATVLYNLVCAELGFSTEAFETPSHVYTLFTSFTERVTVENTTAMGFDIMRNLRAYSEYLAGYYPRSEVLKIGLDRLYAYENSKGRVISNLELLGLIAYNRAYQARKRGDFKTAYELILAAQRFNADSRSNIQFERTLYLEWGERLYKKGEIEEAFQVFADGTYRYPDSPELTHNCRIVFFRVLEHFRMKGKFAASLGLITDMEALEILEDEEKERLLPVLEKDYRLFLLQKDTDHALRTISLMKRFAPGDERIEMLEREFPVR